MKATGIVRRIDDLGRVVIPKEIRRMMRLQEGDPLELFIEGDGVVLKKYKIGENIGDSIRGIISDMQDNLYENDIDRNDKEKLFVLLEEATKILDKNGKEEV